jgi:AraC-like DNA-binding protein
MSILRDNHRKYLETHSQHLWILDLNPENEINSLPYAIQPNLCPETTFHACLPSPYLRNIVSYYHQVHTSKKSKRQYIYPSGNIALVFRCDPLNPDVYLVGTPTIPREPEYIELGLDYFIVFFSIGEGTDFSSVPATELVDTYVPVDRLCLSEIEKVATHIAGKGSFMERVHCFERFMARQKNIINKPHSRLKPVIETICAGTYDDIQQRPAHLSDRHLRRLFNTHVGISPTLFKRVIRHQKAIRALNCDPYQNLAGLSAELGYCDQSHFINEFKRFHGISPVKFIKTYIRERQSTPT